MFQFLHILLSTHYFLFLIVVILFFKKTLAMLHGMWDLSSLTSNSTHAPVVEVWGFNRWTAWEAQ